MKLAYACPLQIKAWVVRIMLVLRSKENEVWQPEEPLNSLLLVLVLDGQVDNHHFYEGLQFPDVHIIEPL